MTDPEPDAFDTTLLAESGPRATPSSRESIERWVGTTLDHFEIETLLGRGGMGAVFLARDRSLDRRVAVKLLLDELADSTEIQERFIREARAQARLNSPQVVHIYYIGRTPARADRPGALYFAMELVEGGSLEDRLNNGERLDAERARQLMLEVARGLRDAQASIIHRDIKPSNLLIDSKGQLKIADFGVAKPVDSSATQITIAGSVVGSPLYMAPEQARGDALDQRADMYAIGCSFYHLLSGQVPFDGKTPLAVISKHFSDKAVPLQERNAKVPPALASIVERLMEKEPERRYASYDELIAALEKAAPERRQPGGFWARGAAVGIDVAIAGTLIGLLGWPGLVLHLAYITLAHAWRGQTLGKYLMNLRVQRPDGKRLGMGRSLARTLASMWLPFLVGLLILLSQGIGELKVTIERMQPSELDAFKALLTAIAIGNALLSLLYVAGLVVAAFHPQKRAAHDLVVGSEVLYQLRR